LKILLFLVSLFFATSLFADTTSEEAVLRYIFTHINSNSFHKIWSDDPSLNNEFKADKNYTVVKDAKDADIVILRHSESLKNIPHNKKIFVLKYSMLSKIPQSFGAFFWQKGRPNIVFLRPRIKKEKLKLSSELQKYEEERIW